MIGPPDGFKGVIPHDFLPQTAEIVYTL